MANSRGSTWNRWDLHLHTPETAKNDNYTGQTPEEKWTNFISTINAYPGEVRAIGITDYFSVDNYKKFLTKLPDITKQIDLVLPNVELRTLPVTGSGAALNIHCIFNPAIVDDLERRFFSKLRFATDTSRSASRADLIQLGRDNAPGVTMTDEVAYKKGIQQFQTDINSFKQVFQADTELAKDTIIVVANSGNDGASGVVKHHHAQLMEGGSQLDTTRKMIYVASQAIFSGSPDDAEFFLGRKVGTDGNVIPESIVIDKAGSTKPCFHGSDAHENAKVFEPDNQRYCWIKAELSFEGLKQTLYEPELRVAIQTESPEADNEKIVLIEFEIEDNNGFKIANQKLELNRDMVAIIGGRGSGKSLLLETLASMNEEHEVEDRNGKPKVIQSERLAGHSAILTATLRHKDGTDEPQSKDLFDYETKLDLPILYIGQERLAAIATDDERLTPTICAFLGIEADTIQSENIEARVKANLAQIDQDTTVMNALEDQYVKSLEPGEKPFLDRLADLKVKKEKQIKRLTSPQTEALVTQLRKVIEQGQRIKAVTERLPILEEDLKNIGVNKSVATANELLAKVEGIKVAAIPAIDTSMQQQTIADIQSVLGAKRTELKASYSAITDQLKTLGVKEDVRLLTESIRKLQDEINDIDKDTVTYEKARQDLAAQRVELADVSDALRKLLESRVQSINDAYDAFKQTADLSDEKERDLFNSIIEGVEVEGEIVFNDPAFVGTMVRECFDGRIVKNNKVIRQAFLGQDTGQITLETFFEFWKSGKIWNLLEQEMFNKYGREKFVDVMFGRWEDFISVRTKIGLDGVSVENLSAGQRGTLLLKIYLASATDKQIFIIDQPEDNLDNKFITTQMVPMLRKIKQTRQVIVSTHNANIAVGCDADQIIVARLDESDDVNRLYASGGIESEEINTAIQNILEGGSKALERRYKRYVEGAIE